MEFARALEQVTDEAPLAHARLHRQLTNGEAARRASITTDEVQFLEEGRPYRFPPPDDALIAMLLYATALGIDHGAALAIAGLPAPPLPFQVNPWRRLGAVAAIGFA